MQSRNQWVNVQGKHIWAQYKKDFPNYYNVPNMEWAASKRNEYPVTENI